MSDMKTFRMKHDSRARELVGGMTLEQKIWLMSGNWSIEKMMGEATSEAGDTHYNMVPYPAGGIGEMGIPPMNFVDGPRGVVCGIGKTTCFPVSMLRGATFDDELEERIGQAIGEEARAFGGNTFAGVCINLPYHPGWGRSQETYGEESFHLGKMGAALVRGVQSRNVAACVKHFAFNSMEIARFKVSVECDRRTEREVYLPHFKDCIDAGASAVMSSYNRYQTTHCGHHRYLLDRVLKKEWDFDGFVMSDFIWGVKDTVEAANGGQDMEMCCTEFFGERLVQAVRDGFVPESRIDDAAVRIVRTLLAFDEAEKANPARATAGGPEHAALALEAARKGIVLMKNDGCTLPFDRKTIRSLAVIGKLADKAVIGDWGSSRVFPEHVVTPLEGLRAACPGIDIRFHDGADPASAAKLAAESDAVVFVVGYDHDDEGEFLSAEQAGNSSFAAGGDRRSLGLHDDEVRLLKTAGRVNPCSAAVLIGGNTILVTEWEENLRSILMAFYPGQEGGTALAEILFGDVNPSGKLPFVLPFREEDLPIVDWDADIQWYDYYHGYARLEKRGIAPLRPYGYGLSYTTFSMKDPTFEADDREVRASCVVRNTGTRVGTQVVQLYAGFRNARVDRPVKLLRGFRRVTLEPGEEVRVEIACPLDRLKWYDPLTGSWVLERMAHELQIGFSSAEADLLGGTVNL